MPLWRVVHPRARHTSLSGRSTALGAAPMVTLCLVRPFPKWPISLSKNALSFFLCDIITAAGAARPEVGFIRAHDIRGVSTSVAFHRNRSVSAVLESATWSSSAVFSSFYLRDIQHEYDGLRSLGPFVAAGSRIE